MSAIHSGPPVLSSEDIRDHYESDPPRMLVVAFCGAGLVFILGLASVGVWLIRTRL